MTTTMQPIKEMLITRLQADRMPWMPLHGTDGVSVKTFWTDPRGESSAGIMKFAPNAQVPHHKHRFAMHHIWVVDGDCHIGGTRMATGSYAFVPLGAEHSITKAGTDGCILMFVYLLEAEMD